MRIVNINKIEYSDHLPKNHINYIMIGVDENEGTLYNYKDLMKNQDKYKKQFGKQKAHPDPDYREEFNCHPNADWK